MAERVAASGFLITPFALVGAGVWLAIALLALGPASGGLELVEVVFLLGPLVVAPIGLDLVSRSSDDQPGGSAAWLSLAQFLWPFGAGGAGLSFFLPGGWLAGVLACVWGATAGMGAIAGVLWWMEVRTARPTVLAPIAALIYLAIGSAWLVVSRFAWNPFALSDMAVLVTAAHLTFAGFGGVLLTWLPLRRLALGSPVRAATEWASIAAIAGVPLLTAGVVWAPAISAAGGVLLSLALPAAAGITAFAVARLRVPEGSWLLFVVSCASATFAMVLAAQYAVGTWLDLGVLPPRRMVEWHGIANALGFVVLGLAGWSLGLEGLSAEGPSTSPHGEQRAADATPARR